MRNRLEMRRVEAQLMTARNVVGLLFAILIAGCAALEKAPVSDPVQNDVTKGAAIATPSARGGPSGGIRGALCRHPLPDSSDGPSHHRR